MNTERIDPDRTTVMIKPVGAGCNLRCAYCYYLPVEADHPPRRMSEDILERTLTGVFERFGDHVTIAWQGGEPTLAGLDFFRRALDIQARRARPNQRIDHALQTNGTRLDDAWCDFLAEHGFLVGLSLDGPARFHDAYRLGADGRSTHEQVVRAMERLRRHQVPFNVLSVLHDRNIEHADELAGYLVNHGVRWLQFIPAIEWQPDGTLAPFSPDGAAYGRFLTRLFDRWFDRWRHQVSVRFFDAVLERLVRGRTPYCIVGEACHHQLTIEADGSIYGCDHFVEPGWRLGQVADEPRVPLRVEGRALATGGKPGGEAPDWLEGIDRSKLGRFAARKQDLAPPCLACRWRPLCHGGCPKHRPGRGDRAATTVLCAGYRQFFEHAHERLAWLAGHLRQGRPPPPPPAGPGHEPPNPAASSAPLAAQRNQPCPCGSGKKFKKCCERIQ